MPGPVICCISFFSLMIFNPCDHHSVMPFLVEQFPHNIPRCMSCNHVLQILDCPGCKIEDLLVTTRTFRELNEPIRVILLK